MNAVKIIAVENLPLIKEGDNLAELISNAAEKQGTPLMENDIIVVTHVVVSKAEGNIIDLDKVIPSERAKELAQQTNKEPALVEVILRETKEIVRIGQNSIITETNSGIICANAGIDRSNVSGDRNVVPLPKNPNASAQNIRQGIKRLTGASVAVIISDTHGRPLRLGEINVAVTPRSIKPARIAAGSSPAPLTTKYFTLPAFHKAAAASRRRTK
ncbi:MAG: coenzyme F420-0:L-glutamate ligase [Candidatus Bathyarchaeia archaeon]